MDRHSTTYRLFVILTTILLVISVTLPSVLMATHCDMNMSDSPKNGIAGEHCPLMEIESTHDEHDNKTSNVDSSFSCDCDMDQLQTQTEAIPSINKAAKDFVVSVTQFIDIEPTTTPTFFTDAVLDQHTETPPIFLLNSVFLN